MNDIPREIEDEFNNWYETQHVVERLSMEGFITASRWHVLDDAQQSQTYMATYRCNNTAVLEQPAYLDRLANPTAWTRKIMPQFKNMVRSVCYETWVAGEDNGTHVTVIRCRALGDQHAQARKLISTVMLEKMSGHQHINSIALWEAATGTVSQASPEESLRGERDQRVNWVVFVQSTGLAQPGSELEVRGWFDSPALGSLIELESCADYRRLSQR